MPFLQSLCFEPSAVGDCDLVGASSNDLCLVESKCAFGCQSYRAVAVMVLLILT